MATFSDRVGFGRNGPLQVDNIDADLRIALWNAFYTFYASDLEGRGDYHDYEPSAYDAFAERLWSLVFKRALDHLPPPDGLVSQCRDWILKAPWNRVYDLLEFFAGAYPPDPIGGFTPKARKRLNDDFCSFCNRVLEREMSGYRFVNKQLVRIIDEQELATIEEALRLKGLLGPTATHLRQALGLLSDRKAPDYRNSIKESISAVEAVCGFITGDPKASLGAALKKVGADKSHPALNSAFDKLYGWTSNAEGIRHALIDDTSVSFDEAKFMLVACSAFTNYLISKSASEALST